MAIGTADAAFAGVSGRRGADSERRRWDVITPVFNDDGVASSPVGDVRHQVFTVAVVMDTRLFRFTVRILRNREESPGAGKVFCSKCFQR